MYVDIYKICDYLEFKLYNNCTTATRQAQGFISFAGGDFTGSS